MNVLKQKTMRDSKICDVLLVDRKDADLVVRGGKP